MEKCGDRDGEGKDRGAAGRGLHSCACIVRINCGDSPRHDRLQQASAPVLAADNIQRLRDEIKAAEEILTRLVDRAAALYLLAHHYARLGEHAKASSELIQV